MGHWDSANFIIYIYFILFLTLQYCIGFAIYQNESATGIHVAFIIFLLYYIYYIFNFDFLYSSFQYSVKSMSEIFILDSTLFLSRILMLVFTIFISLSIFPHLFIYHFPFLWRFERKKNFSKILTYL